MKYLFTPALLILLLGCDSDKSTPNNITQPDVIYVDRNVTEYVDRNVTEYVDRNVTVTEYVDINVIEYVDRNVTEYVDRNVTEYVEVEIFQEPSVCTVQEYDSVFKGRIIYVDKTPYKRGAIKAQGNGWISQGITDDNGEFEISVQGDDRFIFSAASPFGDFKFYAFISPLIVPKYTTTEEIYICEYNDDILTCLEL